MNIDPFFTHTDCKGEYSIWQTCANINRQVIYAKQNAIHENDAIVCGTISYPHANQARDKTLNVKNGTSRSKAFRNQSSTSGGPALWTRTTKEMSVINELDTVINVNLWPKSNEFIRIR